VLLRRKRDEGADTDPSQIALRVKWSVGSGGGGGGGRVQQHPRCEWWWIS
jgi:hypothetical protein